MSLTLDAVILVGYAAVLLATGGWFARRQRSVETFYLADRTLGSRRVFGTTFATFFGTGLVFTLGSFGYLHGVGAFLLVGVAVGGFGLFALAAPVFKRASDRTGAITLPGVMATHWRGRTAVVAAVVTASLFAGTLAANLLVVGTVLETLLGVPRQPAVLGFGILVVTYTTLGGFRGVLVTDLLQTAGVAVAFLLVVPMFVLLAGDGTGVQSLPAGHLDPLTIPLRLVVVYLVVGVLAFFGSQDLFQRVFAARDQRAARRGMGLFAASLAVMGSVAVALGLAARALVPDAGGEAELLLLVESVVPSGFVGIVVVGLLALANGDADSQLLTVASNVTEDLLPRLGYDVDPQREVLVARVVSVAVGTAALLVALVSPGLATLVGAVGSWFAVLGVVVVATVVWERTTDAGVFAALLVGYTLPVGFVAATGEFGAAPVVAVVPTVVVLVAVSTLGNVELGPRLSSRPDR